jgi:uncharacterized membrane protein
MTTSPHNLVAERWVARILRGGIIVSALFMVTGLCLMTIQHGSIILPAENPSLSDLITGILRLSTPSETASTLMYVGLVLLMFTPFLRVIATALAFLVEREWRYGAVALFVLLMLIGEVVFASR